MRTILKRWTTVLFAAGLLLCGGHPRPAAARDVAAVVTQIVGALYVKDSSGASFRKAKKGQFVYEGTTLKTGKGDRAALSFVNGIEVKINQNTTYVVKPTHPSRRGQGSDTALTQGRMWFKVLRKQSKFEIKTPVAAVSVRGTEGDLTMESGLRATCYEGTFNVTPQTGGDEVGDPGAMGEEAADGSGVPVNAGQQCFVEPGKPPELRKLGEDRDRWQDELQTGRQGTIKLSPEKAETARGAAMKITLAVYDSGNHKDTAFQSELKVYSDRTELEYSMNGQSGWQSGGLSLPVVGGAADFYVRSAAPGYANVTCQAEAYEVTPARFAISKPAQREAEIEIEKKNGEKKVLKIKFRR